MCEVLLSCYGAAAQVLATLAGSDSELLQWHLNRQPSKALRLCVEALAYCTGELNFT